MARKTLTDAEGKIMDALWRQSPMTMMEITRTLEGETGWSKHTVTTLLKRMLEKQTVTVDLSGPVRRYSPAMDQKAVARDEMHALLQRMYAGKASLMVSNLVEDGELSRGDLAELLRMLDGRPAEQ